MQKLSIVIPVYNEKATFLQLLKLVEQVNLGAIQKEIVIVNDASTDGTTELLKKLQTDKPDLKIIQKDTNEGKGFALRDGFKHTTGDYIIVQDADLEYDPADYLKLIRALDEAHVDVVYGSRFSGNYKDMSNLHYFGNKFLTILTNVLYGVLLTDMETCYKLLPGDFVRSMTIKSSRFNFEPEITAKILKSGMKITEVPINYKGRSHSEGKKISWHDGLAAVIALLKFRVLD